MAINNITPVNLWRAASGTTDAYAGDGAPLHSLEFHDMVRGNNTIASRIEPGFQFAFDASHGLTGAGGSGLGGRCQTRWQRLDDGITSNIPSSGMAFLGQMPVVVPAGATRLVTSIGIDRYGTNGIDPTGISLAVTQINLFLAASPIASFTNKGARFPVVSQELLGNFAPGQMFLPVEHDVAITATGSADSYSNVVDATWTNFNAGGDSGSPFRTWLIVGATYNSAAVGEYIYLRDFSLWGEFDNSNKFITQFDDAKLALCRNGQGAHGRVMKDLLDALISNASRPRPIFNMWGGSDKINATAFLRQNWLDVSPASPGLGARFLTMPSTGTVDAAQSVQLGVGSLYTGNSADPPLLFDATNPLRYPTNCRELPSQTVPIKEIVSSVSTKMKPYEILIGSNTANGPQLRSVSLFEYQNYTPEHFPTVDPQVPYDNWLNPGQAIIGTETSDFRLRSIRAVRDYFDRVFKARRLAFGWSGILDVSPYDGWIRFTGANPVYIFDQGYGGSGKAPGVTKPGITIPLQYAASGINTRVRVYVSVYARQTGGGTGSLAVYNRNDDGTTMAGPTALTNGPAITSTTWQWYGYSATFNPATDAYFNGNATLPYDRVLLCGKATSGELDIGAFSMSAYHSTA